MVFLWYLYGIYMVFTSDPERTFREIRQIRFPILFMNTGVTNETEVSIAKRIVNFIKFTLILHVNNFFFTFLLFFQLKFINLSRNCDSLHYSCIDSVYTCIDKNICLSMI